MKGKKKHDGAIKLAITTIVLVAPEVLSYYAVKAQTLPLFVLRLVMLLGIILITSYFSSRRLKSNNPTASALAFCFVLMLFMSAFHITEEMPIMTIFEIGYLMFLGTYSKNISLEVLNKALTIVVCVFIPILVYQLLHTEFDMAALLRRGLVWTEIFYYGALTTLWPVLLFSAIILRKNLPLAIIYWLFAVVMNLVSLKKAIFVDSALAFAIITYFCVKAKDTKATKYLLLIGIPFVIGIVYYLSNSASSDVTAIFDAVGSRFEESSEEGAASNNRFLEASVYFSKEANIIDVILGKGLLSAHHALEEEHYFLHIGWLNWIFKGGLILFFTILMSYRKVFKVITNPSGHTKEEVFASLYCVYIFFTLFYVNYMGFGLELFLFFHCLTLLNERNVPNRIPQAVH